jgi:hypothetical protein
MLLVAMVVTSSGDRVDAEGLSSRGDSGLRIESTVDPPRGQWRTVCGYIYNDTPVSPREVRLLVEGRDTSERIVESRVVQVVGYITPWGRTYFCSTVAAGASQYSVTVLRIEWTSDR